jgi:hypothetical protein
MIWLRLVIARGEGMLSWRGVERRENARVRSCGWVWACSWLVFASAPGAARAAELAWRAPDECQRADVARAQVEKLVGQRLAGIDWINFEVEVAINEGGAHRVVLRTLADSSAPREREITGASCAEVTDAVSVAIALTISERERQLSEPEPAVSAPEPVPEAEPSAAPTPEPAPLGFAIHAGLIVESGALPAPVPGLDLGAALEWRSLRIAAFVALFIPQDEQLPNDDRGGTFDLVLAGFDVCAKPTLDALHLLACAGFELGRIGARGNQVLDPREGDAGWYAPRIELGVGYGFAEIARIWLRGGVAIPLARPQFLLNDSEQVHQPSNTSLRGVLAVEILL